MVLDRNLSDYPRGYRVETSEDGVQWRVVAEEPTTHVPITQFLTRSAAFIEVRFPAASARYLRIVQTGEDPTYWWSIHELDIRQRSAPAR